MSAKLASLEDIYSILTRLRQDPKTKKKFPSDIWDAIIRLTETHPLGQVCQTLKIHPAQLKRKMRERKTSSPLEFQEISLQANFSDTIVIELSSAKGIKAKIHGPLSCLNCLHQFFGG